jgi:hypothetical protein
LVGNTFLGIKNMYADYFLVLFSVSCFANTLGLNISSAFNSAVTIYILIPFLIIPQLLLSGLVVKFEKLNPLITNQQLVPLAGDLMASRWGFEALVVNQYKNNLFEKNFFKYDKILSKATFKKDYWIKEIEKKVNSLDNHFGLKEFKEESSANLKLLINELSKELTEHPEIKTNVIEKLKRNEYTLETSKEIKLLLETFRKKYIQLFNKASNKKDAIIYKLEKENKAKFLLLKDNYFNQNLEDLVRNASELDKIIEIDGQLLQRSDPIFKDGTTDEFIRAHFYAPRKNFFGKMVDTYWINIGVLWLMTLVLIITLYFDVLRKLLELGDKLPFLNKPVEQ